MSSVTALMPVIFQSAIRGGMTGIAGGLRPDPHHRHRRGRLLHLPGPGRRDSALVLQVLQSCAPNPPEWIRRCLRSVQQWAQQHGHPHQYIEDQLFEFLPDELRSKCLPRHRLIATDIVHAVPLTLVAGIGHLWIGNFNLMLLLNLLAGSIPGIIIGSMLASKVPERVLQPLLAVVLVIAGWRLLS